MAQRTLIMRSLSLRIVPAMPIIHVRGQKQLVLSKLAPVIAELGSQGYEVILLTGLSKAGRYRVHDAIDQYWPDVVHESIGEGHTRLLQLYMRCACKTALLHPSSPLRALPQPLQQAIIAQGLGPPPALPLAPCEQPDRQVHSHADLRDCS